MTDADKKALSRLSRGASPENRASTDDLQNLLLQVVFALLMVFMIAYFIFVEDAKESREEAVMELNRQKLVLALEKTAENYRARYGINALMTYDNDGSRRFDAKSFIKNGSLELAPAAHKSFSAGAAAAYEDYENVDALDAVWEKTVFEESGIAATNLAPAEATWLKSARAEKIELLRRDVRGMQRSLAAELQRTWIDNPESIGDKTLSAMIDRLKGADITVKLALAAEISDALKSRSLRLISEAAGAEMLK
jgi:hypothetical protein